MKKVLFLNCLLFCLLGAYLKAIDPLITNQNLSNHDQSIRNDELALQKQENFLVTHQENFKKKRNRPVMRRKPNVTRNSSEVKAKNQSHWHTISIGVGSFIAGAFTALCAAVYAFGRFLGNFRIF